MVGFLFFDIFLLYCIMVVNKDGVFFTMQSSENKAQLKGKIFTLFKERN